ncbi:MAG: flavodoxin family protein [candidate division WOR-3 bacterium]
MKVLALIGSARKEGNTAVIVNKILEGIKAKNKKAKINSYFLHELNINPCQSCYSCIKTGRCAQKDDMQKIYKFLKDGDILILGSPIYMDYVSAQTKLFIDRLFPYIHEKAPEVNKNLKAILVITWGWDKEDAYNNVIKDIEKVLKWHKINVKKVIKGYGYQYEKTEVLEDKKLLNYAYRIGYNI